MSDIDSIPVACPKCGASMGRMMRENVQDGSNGRLAYRERIFLATGQFNVYAGFTHCSTCGKPFHFSAPKSSWSELVDRYRKARMETAVLQDGRV